MVNPRLMMRRKYKRGVGSVVGKRNRDFVRRMASVRGENTTALVVVAIYRYGDAAP